MDSWCKEYGKATEIYARAFSRRFNLPLEDVMFQAWVVLIKELDVSPEECLLNQQDIQKMTCAELKKQLKMRGLKTGGSKIELQHRLISWSDHLKEIILPDDSDDNDDSDIEE